MYKISRLAVTEGTKIQVQIMKATQVKFDRIYFWNPYIKLSQFKSYGRHYKH